MTRLPTLLLLLAACSGERAPRPTQIIDTLPAPVAEPEPVTLAMRMAAPTPSAKADTVRRSDTTRIADTTLWRDTVKLADTAIAYSRGQARHLDVTARNVEIIHAVSTSVTVDSTWLVKIGIPFGFFGTFDGDKLKPNADLFTSGLQNANPAVLPARLAVAKAKRLKLLVVFAGGDRQAVKSVQRVYNPETKRDTLISAFDIAKWKAQVLTFQPQAPQIIAAAQAGNILGTPVMDEPFNRGGKGNEANGWGGFYLKDGRTWVGVMTKARVDSLCGFIKQTFPGMATGVFHDWDDFEPDKSYATCDFIVAQYRMSKGDVRTFRDETLAGCRRDKHACAFALNLLDGGITAARDGRWNCPAATTGGRGSYEPNCRMTPGQVVTFGLFLGRAGCTLSGFRYDESMFADPRYQAAFRTLRDSLALAPVTPCRRA